MSEQPTAVATAEIEVRFVNPPKAGKKQATIKAADGAVYGVWPDKVGLFQPGRRYQIEYNERPYQGRTYRTITKCRAHGHATAAQAPSAGGGDSLVATVLGAAIQSKAVEFSEEGIARAIGTIRAALKRAASPAERKLDDEIPF